MSDHPMFEHVPPVLRDHVADYATTLPVILGPKLASAGLEETMGFINGALAHQEALNEDDGKGGSASKWFKGTIISVEREARGKMGSKAKIVFEDSRSGKEQHIHTGWVKYNFRWDVPHWELALSATLEGEAKDLIGKEVLLRKAFTVGTENEHGGTRYRYLADIRPITGNSPEPDDDDEEDDQDEGGDDITPKDIDDLIEDAGEDVDLEDGDYDLILSLADKRTRGINAAIAKYLEMDKGDLKIPDEDDYKEPWEYATLLLAMNI